MNGAPVAGGGVDVLAVLDYEIRTIPISTEDFGPQRSQDVRDLVEARAAVAELIAFARRVLTVHRGQLPSEIADMYRGGCGCPLCEQALAALSNIEGAST